MHIVWCPKRSSSSKALVARARDEVLEKLKGANADKSWQWWKNNWDTAKAGLQELYNK